MISSEKAWPKDFPVCKPNNLSRSNVTGKFTACWQTYKQADLKQCAPPLSYFHSHTLRNILENKNWYIFIWYFTAKNASVIILWICLQYTYRCYVIHNTQPWSQTSSKTVISVAATFLEYRIKSCFQILDWTQWVTFPFQNM